VLKNTLIRTQYCDNVLNKSRRCKNPNFFLSMAETFRKKNKKKKDKLKGYNLRLDLALIPTDANPNRT
jgi:hypothetical protein